VLDEECTQHQGKRWADEIVVALVADKCDLNLHTQDLDSCGESTPCSYFHAKGGCGISVGLTKYTNASLLRVLGVHGLERNKETMWKQSTHICFD